MTVVEHTKGRGVLKAIAGSGLLVLDIHGKLTRVEKSDVSKLEVQAEEKYLQWRDANYTYDRATDQYADDRGYKSTDSFLRILYYLQ